MENIDNLKKNNSNKPKYRLSNANVFVSSDGYHYIDYLDPIEDIHPELDEISISKNDIFYIENLLQSNSQRFKNQANIVKAYLSINKKKILDIGCGGGVFLSHLKNDGASVIGIELSNTRAYYTKTKHNINVVKRPIEDNFWQSKYYSSFDAVTLWDVIEHVNYPLSTLRSATNVLKSGGYLFIDTPCRNSFYHRIGEITYKLSNGKFPTFLNAMYSAHKYGHKQIFSTYEIKNLLEQVNLEVIELKKFHELSFPISFYLKKLLKSNLLVKTFLPVIKILLYMFPIKNKMLVIGRRK